MLIAQKATYRRAIQNAIEVKSTQYIALQNGNINVGEEENSDEGDDS